MRRLTSVLVGNHLGLVVDGVGDGAVGVAKGDTNDGAVVHSHLLVAHLCSICKTVGSRRDMQSRSRRDKMGATKKGENVTASKKSTRWWGFQAKKNPCQNSGPKLFAKHHGSQHPCKAGQTHHQGTFCAAALVVFLT